MIMFKQFCLLLTWSLFVGVLRAQPVGTSNDALLRGPQNTMQEGVIDGVVPKDEVPVRSHVEYEYVRLADYSWSKRIFSRIDARQKVNYPLFYPFDEVDLYVPFRYPTKPEELLSNENWIRHQERYSLWTIIQMHVMNGNLTIFETNSSGLGLGVIEDGYQLKYPIIRKDLTDFYLNNNGYRDRVIKLLSTGGKKTEWFVTIPGEGGGETTLRKGARISQSFKQWVDSLTDSNNKDLWSDMENEEVPGTYYSKYDEINSIMSSTDPSKDAKTLEQAWNEAGLGMDLMEEAKSSLITSRCITAYNIKEDWFFDKERSVLDKRIIAIAPVGRYRVKLVDKDEDPDRLDRYRNFVIVDSKGNNLVYGDKGLEELQLDQTKETVEERELFWLYFPQLRNVMVNYYVYNNQSDAQWMSFDDFFWKRMFSATIYRASDQFDRDVEDYRYGVDALYEAEKIKENMRTWETDLWNY